MAFMRSMGRALAAPARAVGRAVQPMNRPNQGVPRKVGLGPSPQMPIPGPPMQPPTPAPPPMTPTPTPSVSMPPPPMPQGPPLDQMGQMGGMMGGGGGQIDGRGMMARPGVMPGREVPPPMMGPDQGPPMMPQNRKLQMMRGLGPSPRFGQQSY
jgi:hypothetical protein